MKIQKAIVIGFIACSLISTLGVFPIDTYADDSLSGNTNSGGSMDTGDDAAYAHKFMSYPENQGYRISIVDKNGDRVTNSVDIVNYVPSKLLSGSGISSGNSKNTTDYQTGFNQYKNYIGWEDRTADGGKASNFLYSCGIKTEDFSRVTWSKNGVPINDKGISTYMYPKVNIESGFAMAYNDTASLKNSQGMNVDYMKTSKVDGNIELISIPLASKMQNGEFIAGGTKLMDILNTSIVDKNTNSSVGNYATILVNMRIRQFDNRGTEHNNYDYLFKFNDSSLQSLVGTKDTSGTTISQSAIISKKGYKVIIEPIYWYVPEVLTSDVNLIGANSKHGASIRHMKYVCYGTVSYIAKYTEDILENQQNFSRADLDKIWVGANWGGAGLGVTSLMIARDDNDLMIREPSQANLTAKPDLANCFSLADLAYGKSYKTIGYALHIYDNLLGVTDSTWDGKPIEGPAPTPPKAGTFNVVKFYMKKSADGNSYVPYKNFTTKNSSPLQNIVNENGGKYKVISYFTSPTFSQPSSDSENYDSYYNNMSRVQSGNSTGTITMANTETTLYLKLGEDTGSSVVDLKGLTQLQLYQNELSYPYTLGSFRTDGSLEELHYDFPDMYDEGVDEVEHTTHEQGPDGEDRESTEIEEKPWHRELRDDNYNININNIFDYNSTSFIGGQGSVLGKEAGKNITTNGNRAADIHGFDTESLNPNWKFTYYRDKNRDLVTPYPNKNSGSILSNLGLLGISGPSYTPTSGRVAATGEGSFTNTFNVNYNNGNDLDKTLSWEEVGGDDRDGEGSYDGNPNKDVSAINSVYNVENNLNTHYYVGNATSQDTSDISPLSSSGFSHFGMTFADGSSSSLNYRKTVSNQKSVQFYPYILMKYQDTDSASPTNVIVTGTQLRTFVANNTVDVAVYKKNASVPPLSLESSQWNMHQRTLAFLNRHNISDKQSVLPGGAVYTLKGNGDGERWIGIRTYQVVLPDESVGKVTARDMQSQSEADSVLNSFLGEVPSVLNNYNVEQWVKRGLLTEGNIYKTFVGSDGTNVAKVSGTNNSKSHLYNKLWSSETDYGATYIDGASAARINQSSLNTNMDKYYLKANSEAVDGAKLSVLDTKSDKIVWTLRSDENGNVNLTSTSGINASINKNQSASALLSQNPAIAEMDNRTKAVSNFVGAIERNKGLDRNGQTWYNEGFESIQIIESYNAYKLGFSNSNSVRSSALDPKLTGYLKDRSDTFRYGDEEYYKASKTGVPITSDKTDQIITNKVRSSIFKTSAYSESKPSVAGYLGSFDGEDITLGDMDFYLFSKNFYIPNATVMDLN